MVTFKIPLLHSLKQISNISSSLETSGPGLRHDLKSIEIHISFLLSLVKERTVRLGAALSILADRSLVVIRMELELLPAMRPLALSSIRTPLVIISDIVLRVPMCALLRLVEVKMPLASEVLPVVSIHTR